MTMMRSKLCSVDSRCAMAITVRPCISRSSACLDRLFAFAVQCAGRLVQQQDRRVLQQCPGDRQPLTLSAGELHAAVADHGGEAIGQRLDELAAVRHLGGGQHVLPRSRRGGRSGCSPAPNGGTGEMSCGTIAIDVAQAVLRHVADVLAVDRDAAAAARRRSAAAAPARWICRRRSSRPARPAGLAAIVRSKSRSTGGAAGIGEAHMVERHFAGPGTQRLRVRPVRQFVRRSAGRRWLPPAARHAGSGRPAPPRGRACCAGC